MQQTTAPITDTEQETPDQHAYVEVCAKLTALNCQIDEVQHEYDAYRFLHPKYEMTQMGMAARPDAQRDQLESRLNELLAARQHLFPEHAELKFRLGLTR
jgi:hypothetical protein